MDVPSLASVVTVEASVVVFVSTLTSTSSDVVVSVGAAVIAFVVSTTCFSVNSLAVVANSFSVVIFFVTSVVSIGEVALSVLFSVTAAVEIASIRVAEAGFAVLETSTFAVASIKGSVDTASVSLATVVTGSSVVTLLVRSAADAVVSSSVTTDVVDFSLVAIAGKAVVYGVVVSVIDSVGTFVLASVITVEATVVTFASTLTSTGSNVVFLVGAAVLVFVVPNTCFSVVAWEVAGSSTAVVTFCVTLVGCAWETVASVSFSVSAAVQGSSETVGVIGLAGLRTSTFVMASVRGSIEANSFSLAAVITEASVVNSVLTSTAPPVVSTSVARDVVDALVVLTAGAAVGSGGTVSVTESVDTSVLASVVTVEDSGFTSVSTMTSTGSVAVSVCAVVVLFLVSGACFSVVTWLVEGGSVSVVTFCLTSVVCTGETVLSGAVDVSLTTMPVVSLTVVWGSTFVLASIKSSVETASVHLAVVVTGASVVTPVLTSTPAAVVSASAATDAFDTSLVFIAGGAVLCKVVVSVIDSVDTSISASVATVEDSVVVSVSTITFPGAVLMLSVGAVVVAFVVTITCFCVAAWAVAMKSFSVVTFSVTLVVFARGTRTFGCFSVPEAVEFSSKTVGVVALAVLMTSTFVVASV